MSYLDKPTQEQSLNGVITLSDGFITIENGEISGLSNLNIGDNIVCKSLTTGNLFASSNILNIGDDNDTINIRGSNINLIGPTVYIQSQTVQTIDNNIQLNYGGNNSTAIGSGISVLGASNNPIANIILDANLDWNLTSVNNKLSVANIASSTITNSGIITTGALSVIGNATLGDASTDALTINATPTIVPNATFNNDIILSADGKGIDFFGAGNKIIKKVGEGLSVETTSFTVRDTTGANAVFRVNQPSSAINGVNVSSFGQLAVNKASADSNIYLDVNGNFNTSGITKITNLSASTSTLTGALQVSGGAGIAGAINIGGTCNIAGISRITNTTTSSNTTTGALVVSGGCGIGGDVNFGGKLYLAGDGFINGNLNVTQNTNLSGPLTVSNIATFQSNLNVQGNINVVQNVVVDGNISVSVNVSGNVVSGNVVTGTKGQFTESTAGKAYSTNHTAYTSSISHLNVNTVASTNIRGDYIHAINIKTSNRITTNELFGDFVSGSTVSGNNGSFTNVSVSAFGTFNLMPSGTIQMTVINTILPPTGWLYCRGQAIDRTVYSNLFLAIGVTFGAGDGTTTFNIPDFRGMFLRGYGVNGYTDPNTGIQMYSGTDVGVIQRDSLQNHEHNIVMQTINSQISNYQGGGTGDAANDSWTAQLTQGVNGLVAPYYARQSGETRPVNYSVNYLIRI